MGDNQSQMAETQSQTDADLLSYLTQLLNSRPEQSLLLSDLGALLPDTLRVAIRENGGLRTCVQKFPIFKVSGQPGRERVTLHLGLSGEDLDGYVGLESTATPPDPKAVQEFDDDASDENDRSIVQLRGLPYRATEDDVQNFLGPHLAHLKDSNSIELLLSRDGRPSGFARVQFSCPAAARAACSELHERVMNIEDAQSGASSASRHRYVEVFLYSEHPGKLRFKKSSAQDGQDVDLALEAEAAQITPDQIAAEVRHYMAQEGKGELLLSMLGVALSPAARLYLRKNDRGVKRFLAQYPNEFAITGEKGRERITYMPYHNCISSVKLTSSTLTETDMFAVPELRTQHSAEVNERLLTSPSPWASPDPLSRYNASPTQLATPSCWGTPDLHQDAMPGMLGAVPPDMSSMGPLMQSVWMPQNQWDMGDLMALAHAVNVNVLPPPDPRMGAAMPPPPVRSAAAMPPPPVETNVAEPPVVRLRGLPFDTTAQEVLAFFAQHGVANRVSDGSNAVQLMTKSNGKPSGSAMVQLRNFDDVDVVQRTLHLATIGKRYVEVLTPNASEPKAPTSNFQQDSADRFQQNVVQNAPPQAMAGPNLYTDTWLLSQLAVSMAHCSTEGDFANSLNTGFKTLPREECGQMLGLRV